MLSLSPPLPCDQVIKKWKLKCRRCFVYVVHLLTSQHKQIVVRLFKQSTYIEMCI